MEEQEKPHRQSPLIITLAIASLFFVGFILGRATWHGAVEKSQQTLAQVLGTVKTLETSPPVDIERVVEKALKTAKTGAEEGVKQLPNENALREALVKNIEKEIQALTASQIQSVQRDICIKWGVITTATPSAWLRSSFYL